VKNVGIIGVIAFAVLGFLLYRRAHSRSQIPKGPSSKSSQEVYLGLRNLALEGSRAKFNLVPTSTPTEPWGVVMDWGLTSGTASVLALSDGHASIYLSSSGGYLGGSESHESVRSAAKRMVAAAVESQSLTRATTEFPLPREGQVFFYLLTDAGVFTADASQKDLSSHVHPLSKLGDAAQEVIKEYRLVVGPGK
jgi:hypothetical protein